MYEITKEEYLTISRSMLRLEQKIDNTDIDDSEWSSIKVEIRNIQKTLRDIVKRDNKINEKS